MAENQPLYPKLSKFMNEAWLKYFMRHHGGVSQNDFGTWLGVSSSNVSRYIRGVVMPDPANQDKIAARLGVGIYDACEVARRIPPSEKVLNKLAADLFPDFTDDKKKSVLAFAESLRDKEENGTDDATQSVLE